MATPVLSLPESLRAELKEPLGTLHTDVETLLADVDGLLIAVGDIVTAHFEEAGRRPDLAIYDERTEREPIDETVSETLARPDRTVENPSATLTADLLRAIGDGIGTSDPFVIRVRGEEDLATLPAIVAAPDDASVVYGQPGEGMVSVRVTDETRAQARHLLERMDGDSERAIDILDA